MLPLREESLNIPRIPWHGIWDKLTRGQRDKGISQNIGRKNLEETQTSSRLSEENEQEWKTLYKKLEYGAHLT